MASDGTLRGVGCHENGKQMLFVGLAFIAAAAVALRLARPRKGVVKMVNSPLLGDLTALSIAAAGVIGVVITLVGLGRF